MTPEEFVKGVYQEKQYMLEQYFDARQATYASVMINELNLNGEAMQKLKTIIDTVMTDAYYTFLLGIDGEANIGGNQHMYKLLDEDNNELTGSGEIEGFAYEYFHGTENK